MCVSVYVCIYKMCVCACYTFLLHSDPCINNLIIFNEKYTSKKDAINLVCTVSRA